MADLKLKLNAGPHHRVHCPVSTVLDAPEGTTTATLTCGGQAVPCQCRRDGDGLRVSWIVRDLAAGAEGEYEVNLGAGPDGGDGVALTQKAGEIQVDVNGTHVTSYRYGEELARPHLYPVIGPYGDGITRELLKEGEGDHHHHKSIYVSHGEVNGFNNWAESEGHGKTVHESMEAVESGPVLGRIVALGKWVGSPGWVSPHRGNELLDERTEWTFYNTPDEVRIIDLHLTLTATKLDVLFGDTKEGGLASVRVMPSMDVKAGLGGKIENANGGKNEDETWGKRAAWCDYTGPVNDKTVGITAMDHPDSFRHPTYWHVRNYGLMTANPFGVSHYHNDPKRRGWHVLSPGESLVGIYRFYVHKGDAGEAGIGERYHDFANPPKIETADQ